MQRPLDRSPRRAARAATLAAALLLLPSARQLHAQGATATDAAIALRSAFVADLDSTQAKFLALAEAIPADKYAWRPAAGVRSIGEVFKHVASEYYVYTPMSQGATPSPVVGRGREAFQQFEAAATKDDVLKHLKEGFAFARQAVNGVEPANLVGVRKIYGRDFTIAQTSLLMAGDLHEHLGQLIAYARMNGVKPPWTR
jgi:uncharacterized damage-inducible protein DinB